VLQAPHVKSGKLRGLAVTSTRRVKSVAEIPTVAESGLPGYAYWGWMGLAAPSSTPPAIIERLNAEMVKILRTAEARDWFEEQGGEPVGDRPEDFAAFVKAEHAKWGRIIREAKIKVD
jgi:tripartite-type tricarboxylate transporter receptor subunit TctC